MGTRMRIVILLIGSAGLTALALGTGGAAAKPSTKKVRVNCAATAYNESAPKLSGLALAQLKCTKPFGAGVQEAHNKTTITGSTVHVTGSFKNFFNQGTTSGVLKLSGPVTPGAITVTGKATITRGTGAFKHMKGTGPVKCKTTDGGKTFHCTVKGTATR